MDSRGKWLVWSALELAGENTENYVGRREHPGLNDQLAIFEWKN